MTHGENIVCIDGKEVKINGKLLKQAKLVSEPFEYVENPYIYMDILKNNGIKPNIFSFLQKIFETGMQYDYVKEYNSFAVMNIISYDNWIKNKISKDVRKKINKSLKKGVKIETIIFNDDLVKGIVDIYNESPIRQGKPFPHYNKDFGVVKKENSTFMNRSDYIGAYFNEEFIGYLKLVYDNKCAYTMQVISKIKHRDKSINNALIAKAVEICDTKGIKIINYGTWSGGGLADFKKSNGFERMDIPRYYIPMDYIGEIAIRMGFHKNIYNRLPDKLINIYIKLRKQYYFRKYRKFEVE